MMKKNLKLIGMILFFTMFLSNIQFSMAALTPSNYSDAIYTNNSLSYDILDSNGVFTYYSADFMESNSCLTEVGGRIEFNFTVWNNDEPYFDVSFYDASNTLNVTLTNESNTNIAINLIMGLGWNAFVPGVFSTVDWTNNDNQAKGIADGTLAGGYYGGNLSICDLDNLHCYNYLGLGDYSIGQETFLCYNKSSGILIGIDSTSFGYYLKAELNGYDIDEWECILDEKEDKEDKDFEIPGFTMGSFLILSMISITAIIIKKKHNISRE